MAIGDMVRTETGNVGRVVEVHKPGPGRLYKEDGVRVELSDGTRYWRWASEVTAV